MKKKKNEEKWYLFMDGKQTRITNSAKEFSQLKGVLIEITPHEAASILTLVLETKAD